jgi:3',5'-cyclic-AMP phosphodiesterase
MVGGLLAAGIRLPARADTEPAGPLRLVFATDLHLMLDNGLRSEDGIRAVLATIEALKPAPDLMICGGDLTDPSPSLDCATAEALLNRFETIWTPTVETHYVFGNHDLVGTKNTGADRSDARFGKGLYRQRFGLHDTFYSFEKAGWRFVILDDVWPNPDGTYFAEFVAPQLEFLQHALRANPEKPTIIAHHIPAVSVLPNLAGLAKVNGSNLEVGSSLIARNTKALLDIVHGTGANLRLVLAGHLHHQEQIIVDGIEFLNGGAICGNWWKGPQAGCPEGFNVIDLKPDGTYSIQYLTYGWQA